MQVKNLETKRTHHVILESYARCDCCGDHLFKILVDGESAILIEQLSNGTLLTTETGQILISQTLNDLRRASGFLSLEEFLAL